MNLPPSDNNGTPGAPVNDHPQHPNRMVNTNSRTAAFLRHAGLEPTDVAGEGTWVTMAEAEAEAARRGLTVNLPEPLPPLDAGMARAYVQRPLAMGGHLMRLAAGSKTPVDSAWQHAPALTEDEATDWLVRGENLGVNLLRSGDTGWAVLDAENSAATAILTAAGLIPTAVTANAQDRTTDKFGGCHVWMRLPADIDPASLKSTLQLKLDGGGLIDILVGTRYVVAPGTVLDQAPGYRYAFAATGAAMNPEVWFEAAPWLIDASAPSPGSPGIEPLLGVLRPKRREKRAPSPDGDPLTAQVDEVPWEDWLDGDPRVQILGGDGGCGCPVFHWASASTQRSGILHEGCELGSGMHAFSGTLTSVLGAEHMSRLHFAAWLHGLKTADAARRVGIEIGSKPAYNAITADDIDEFRSRRATPDLRIVPDSGGAPVAGIADPVAETDAETAPVDTSAKQTAGASDDVEPEEDTGLAMFRRIGEIDASGFWDTLPILRRISKAADSHGVGRWGLLGAVLPRIACSVPPFVRLVGASGKEGGQNSGASLNLNTILTGPPEEGKSEVIKLSQDLVALPEHASPITNGTGEGIVKSFSYTKKAAKKAKEVADEPVGPKLPPAQPGSDDGAAAVPAIGNATPARDSGYETVHITDTVMLTAGEISGMIAEMRRQGTKATSVYRSAWVGEELGTTTGEVDRRTYLAPHSYRFGAVLGSQVDVDTLGAIFDEGKLGSPQRFLFLPVQTKSAIGEPVRSIEIKHIDWFDGQAPAAAVGGLVAPHPPVFIHRPTAAHEEIEANRSARQPREHLSYSVAEVRRRAEDDDSIDDIKGHELLHQLKIATALAIADGLRKPTDEYWHAARVIMQVRDLTVGTLMKVIIEQRDVADRKRGRSQGKSSAEARAIERAATGDGVLDAAMRLLDLIDAAAGIPEQAAQRKKVLEAKNPRQRNAFRFGKLRPTYAKLWLSNPQKGHFDDAVALLKREFGIVADGLGDLSRGPITTVITSTGPGAVLPAAAATPKIGSATGAVTE